jgi:hypothetical protein
MTQVFVGTHLATYFGTMRFSAFAVAALLFAGTSACGSSPDADADATNGALAQGDTIVKTYATVPSTKPDATSVHDWDIVQVSTGGQDYLVLIGYAAGDAQRAREARLEIWTQGADGAALRNPSGGKLEISAEVSKAIGADLESIAPLLPGASESSQSVGLAPQVHCQAKVLWGFVQFVGALMVGGADMATCAADVVTLGYTNLRRPCDKLEKAMLSLGDKSARNAAACDRE